MYRKQRLKDAQMSENSQVYMPLTCFGVALHGDKHVRQQNTMMKDSNGFLYG